MPAATSKLDMINYPLFISEGAAMWRQVGVQTTTKTNLADFNVGIFNGGPAEANAMADNNDAQDVLLRAGFKPPTDFAKIKVGGYAWLGNLLMADDDDLAYNMFGFFGTLKNENLTFNAEYIMGAREQAGGADDLKSMAYYGHVGYKVTPSIEVLGRYDFVDENTDLDDDAWTWITLGANYYVDSYNAMIYLNYIMKMEENDWGMTEKLKNDELKLQFQVAF